METPSVAALAARAGAEAWGLPVAGPSAGPAAQGDGHSGHVQQAADNHRQDLADKDRDPCPAWDGPHLIQNLKPYMRALEFWQ